MPPGQPPARHTNPGPLQRPQRPSPIPSTGSLTPPCHPIDSVPCPFFRHEHQARETQTPSSRPARTRETTGRQPSCVPGIHRMCGCWRGQDRCPGSPWLAAQARPDWRALIRKNGKAPKHGTRPPNFFSVTGRSRALSARDTLPHGRCQRCISWVRCAQSPAARGHAERG